MTETTFVNHAPNTYKAYKTIGGWSIMFLDDKGNSRPADMGKVYKNRQNAYARVKAMNHPIAHKIGKTGMVEAYHDGYTLVVSETEGTSEMHDDGSTTETEDGYTLYFKVGDMPPHDSKNFKTVEEVENYIRDETHFPLYLDWKKVETEA